MNITSNCMNKGQINRGLAVCGYGCLSTCGMAQWTHTLILGRNESLSLGFVAAYVMGLALLQVSFRLSRAGLVYEIGNGLGLFNALMMLGAWWWVR